MWFFYKNKFSKKTFSFSFNKNNFEKLKENVFLRIRFALNNRYKYNYFHEALHVIFILCIIFWCCLIVYHSNGVSKTSKVSIPYEKIKQWLPVESKPHLVKHQWYDSVLIQIITKDIFNIFESIRLGLKAITWVWRTSVSDIPEMFSWIPEVPDKSHFGKVYRLWKMKKSINPGI